MINKIKVKFIAGASYGDKCYEKGQVKIISTTEYINMKLSCEPFKEKRKAGSMNTNSLFVKPIKYDRVLVVKSYGIGNIIYITPAIAAIKESFPQCKIDLLVEGETQKMMLNKHELINKIYTVREIKKLIKSEKKYDIIVNGLPNEINISDCGITGDVITENSEKLKSEHEIKVNLDILEQMGIVSITPPDPFMYISRGVKKKIKELLPSKYKYFGIAAGFLKSGIWYKKNWGYEKYADLVMMLLKKYKGYKALILGAGDDDKVLDFIKDKSRVLNLTNRFTINESAEMIRRCEFIVANDTGLAHVAGAVGTKAYTIFGPTPESKVQPIGGVVIENGIECRPCMYKPEWSTCTDYKCLQIDPKTVYGIITGDYDKKYQLGIMMATYDRYELLAVTLDNIIHKLNHSSIKFSLVDDGTDDDRMRGLLHQFKVHFKGKFVYRKHKENMGKPYYKDTLWESYEALKDCEYIVVIPDDVIMNNYIYDALKKGIEYFKDSKIKCLSFFRDSREKDMSHSESDEYFKPIRAYDDYFNVTGGVDGLGVLFRFSFLDQLDWKAPSTEKQTQIWRHIKKQFKKGNVLTCKESLFEHIGNIDSKFWTASRRLVKIWGLCFNQWRRPAMLAEKFNYSVEWYEKEYHSKGDYFLPDRTYDDIMGEWTKAGYKKRLYTVMDAVEKEVDLNKAMNVLEIGCHHGKTVFWLCERYKKMKFVAFDFSRVAIEWCNKYNPYKDRADFKIGSAGAFEYGFKFDLITCLDIAEHLPEDIYFYMLCDIYKALKPGGYLIFYCGQTELPEHINVRFPDQIKKDLKKFKFIADLPDDHLLFKKER